MFRYKLFMWFMLIIVLVFSGLKVVQGQNVHDFTLENYDGTAYTLSEIKNAGAIVVMFIATQCPISNDYNERMVEIYDAYTPKGVVFLGINSNKQESVEEVAAHAAEHGFKFPVLKDPGNKIADQYDAQVTPEIFVLDTSLQLLYHGRIDDSRRVRDVESEDLKNALDQILAGEEVAVKETKAFGCTIKRVD